jgi:dTDP-4-dehydrorhamnose reductase
MALPIILVTGANGQLGKELQDLSARFPAFRFVFLSRADLPIHHFELLKNFFEAYHPAYCINAAAYTAVDRAETEKELAMLVNGEAVGMLAEVSKMYGTHLVHVSTDYVFNGQSSVAYKESDPVDPINAYGRSKLDGEQRCLRENPDAMIIRTSWVYSSHGNNFVKTMLRLMSERTDINVVDDQIGSPTYAADLAEAIMQIIGSGKWLPGIYHFSGLGQVSWYEFALAIRELTGKSCNIHPIPSSAYPVPAKRPSFSLLNTDKIRQAYHVAIPDWKTSLETCLKSLASS